MPKTPWRKLLALLAVALLLRLAAGWAWQERLPGRFGMGDSESYWQLASAIAEGRPYEYGSADARVFRTPGYPVLLAPVVWIAGNGMTGIMAARAEAAILGTLAVLAVWWLTRLLFDDRAALLACAFATFYPGAVVLSALVLSEAPFCPLMLLQLGLWVLAWRATSWRKAIALAFLAGLAAGAATLMRPSWLLFTPFAVVAGTVVTRFLGTPNCSQRCATACEESPTPHCLLETVAIPSSASSAEPPCGSPASSGTLQRPRENRCVSRTLQFGISAAMLFGLAVAMTPWWIRNASVTGHFIPTTLQVGASLYDGLNPKATGGSDLEAFVPGFTSEEREAERDALRSLPFEMRLDHRMRDAALAWAWANPGAALRLAGVKFLRMWNVWPNEARFSSWPIRLAVFFTYTPVLIFAIIGAWRTRSRGWPYVLCVLPAVYLTLLHMVFVSSIRYREPAMLALMVLAAGAIDWQGVAGGLARRGSEEG